MKSKATQTTAPSTAVVVNRSGFGLLLFWVPVLFVLIMLADGGEPTSEAKAVASTQQQEAGIHRYDYDLERQTFYVVLGTGIEFAFQEVEPELYHRFNFSGSKEDFFRTHILHFHPCRRVTTHKKPVDVKRDTHPLAQTHHLRSAGCPPAAIRFR